MYNRGTHTNQIVKFFCDIEEKLKLFTLDQKHHKFSNNTEQSGNSDKFISLPSKFNLSGATLK